MMGVSKFRFGPCPNCCTRYGDLIINSDRTYDIVDFQGLPIGTSLTLANNYDDLGPATGGELIFCFSADRSKRYGINTGPFTPPSSFIVRSFPSGTPISATAISSNFPSSSETYYLQSIASELRNGKVQGYWQKTNGQFQLASPSYLMYGRSYYIDSGANYEIDPATGIVSNMTSNFQRRHWDLMHTQILVVNLIGSPVNQPAQTVSFKVSIPGMTNEVTINYSHPGGNSSKVISIPIVTNPNLESYISGWGVPYLGNPATGPGTPLTVGQYSGKMYYTALGEKYWNWYPNVNIIATNISSGFNITLSIFRGAIFVGGPINALFPSVQNGNGNYTVWLDNRITPATEGTPNNSVINGVTQYNNNVGNVLAMDYDATEGFYYYLISYGPNVSINQLYSGWTYAPAQMRLFKFDNDQQYVGETQLFNYNGTSPVYPLPYDQERSWFRGLAKIGNDFFYPGLTTSIFSGQRSLIQHRFGTQNALGHWQNSIVQSSGFMTKMV